MDIRDPETGERIWMSFALGQAYLKALEPLRPVCDHQHVVRCARGSAEVDQCKACGAQRGGAFKRSAQFEGLPKFKEGSNDRWQAGLNAERRLVESEYLAKARAEASSNIGTPMQEALDYAAYLRTDDWQRKRARVLHRANGICEGCLERPATEVHHTTYDHRGNELLFELVALCRDCHLKAHPEHRETEEFYEDYSTCASCRYDGGGVQCLKFGIPVFQAFSRGGGCFPPGSAFEGLK